jgi:hypothetical protein
MQFKIGDRVETDFNEDGVFTSHIITQVHEIKTSCIKYNKDGEPQEYHMEDYPLHPPKRRVQYRVDPPVESFNDNPLIDSGWFTLDIY